MKRYIIVICLIVSLRCWGKTDLNVALASVENMKLYVQQMPDINSLVEDYTDYKGTLLYWAVLKNKPDIVQYLLEYGVDPAIPAVFKGSIKETPLMVAAWFDYAYERDGKVLDILIATKKGFEIKNETGHTILEIAALRGDCRLVKKLLDASAHAEIGRLGYTPLTKSIRSGAIKTTQVFLDAGAQITCLAGWFAFWGPYVNGSINYEHGKKIRAVVYQEAKNRIKKKLKL